MGNLRYSWGHGLPMVGNAYAALSSPRPASMPLAQKDRTRGNGEARTARICLGFSRRKGSVYRVEKPPGCCSEPYYVQVRVALRGSVRGRPYDCSGARTDHCHRRSGRSAGCSEDCGVQAGPKKDSSFSSSWVSLSAWAMLICLFALFLFFL